MLVGRDSELTTLCGLLADREGQLRGCRIVGEAGAGKTALVRAAVEQARSRGYRVLQAGPTEVEADLPLAALRDMLVDVEPSLTAIPTSPST
jgi:hypothetical protein